MVSWLVEAYVPQPDSEQLPALVARLQAKAAAMRSEGIPVRHVRSILLPGEETCLHLIEGPSAAVVSELGRRADLICDHIAEARE